MRIISQSTKVSGSQYKSKAISSENQSKRTLDFSWTALVSLILTAFTAVAFGSGQAYRNAYSTPFGFDTILIPWSFQDTVYIGIVKQIDVIVFAPFWAAIVFMGMVGILAIYVEFKKIPIKKTKTESDVKLEKFLNEHPFINIFIVFFTKFVAFGFFILLLGTYFVVNAEKLGANDAKNDREVILKPSIPENEKAKKGLRWLEIHRVVGGKEIVDQGYLVDCNEHVCGIYSPDTEGYSNRLIKLDNLVSMVITKPFK